MFAYFFRMMHTYSVQRNRFVIYVSFLAMSELPVSQFLVISNVIYLQVKGEVHGVLEFIDYVYKVFGFTYELKLSTVPYLMISSPVHLPDLIVLT